MGLYSYVHDVNAWVDPCGLLSSYYRGSKGTDPPHFIANDPVYNHKGKQTGGDYKINKETGNVETTHGVSVFNNPGSVKIKGFTPHEIDKSTFSDKLEIKQRGSDPAHFEIVPKKTMPPAEYKAELAKIKTIQ